MVSPPQLAAQQKADALVAASTKASFSLPPNIIITFKVISASNIKGSKGDKCNTLLRAQFADFENHDSDVITESGNPEYNFSFDQVLPPDEASIDVLANKSLTITVVESLPKDKSNPLGVAEINLFKYLIKPFLKDPVSEAPVTEAATSFQETLPITYFNPKILAPDIIPELMLQVTLNKPALTLEQLEKGAFASFKFSSLLPLPEEWSLKEASEKDLNSNMYHYTIHCNIPTEKDSPRVITIPKGTLATVDQDGYFMDPASFTLQPVQINKHGSAGDHSGPKMKKHEVLVVDNAHVGKTFPAETKQIHWDGVATPMFWFSPAALVKFRQFIQDKNQLSFTLSREPLPRFASVVDPLAAKTKAVINVDASLLLLSRVVGLKGRLPVEDPLVSADQVDPTKTGPISVYKSLGSSINVDVSFTRPITEKKKILPLTQSVRDFIPARQMNPDDSFREKSAQADKSFQKEIRSIVYQLMSEYAQVFEDSMKESSPDSQAPHSQPEYRRKKFLHHLNVSGVYFEFKEKLKTSVVGVVRERFKKRSPFASDSELQVFISDVYVYLVDQMHVAINNLFFEKQISNFFVDPTANHTATLSQLKTFADIAESDGLLSVAVMHHQERIIKFSNSLVPWFDYGSFCMRNDMPDKGEECFKEILSRDPNHIPSLMALGSICASTYRLPEGRVYLDTAVKLYPMNSLSTALLGYYYEINGDESEAEKVLAEAVALHSQDSKDSIYIHVAKFSVEIHAVQMAERAIAQEILNAGNQLGALMLLHQLELQRFAYPAAMSHLEKARSQFPDCLEVLAAMGHLDFRQKKFDTALSFYERVINLSKPADPYEIGLVYQRLGEIYLHQSKAHPVLLDTDLAELSKQMFIQACLKCPTSVSWTGLGKACIALEAYEDAEDALSEANVLNNKDSAVWVHLALVARLLERDYEANQCLSYALKLGVKDAEILKRVGQAFMDSQQPLQASECFRMALELEPSNTKLRELFIRVLHKNIDPIAPLPEALSKLAFSPTPGFSPSA